MPVDRRTNTRAGPAQVCLIGAGVRDDAEAGWITHATRRRNEETPMAERPEQPEPPVDPSEVAPRTAAPEGATPDHPLGSDRAHFDPAPPGEGGLKDRVDLIDEDGDDIRQYTGEPVETEEGWVLPRQQNVGKENMAGRGEWPDPNAPPA
jgi:hypothetical protein